MRLRREGEGTIFKMIKKCFGTILGIIKNHFQNNKNGLNAELPIATRSLVPGPWSLVPGPWSLVPGPGYLKLGI